MLKTVSSKECVSLAVASTTFIFEVFTAGTFDFVQVIHAFEVVRPDEIDDRA